MLEGPDGVGFAALAVSVGRIRVKFPGIQHGVLATRNESRVIFKPSDPLDRLGMGRKLESYWALGRIEVVYPDLLVVLAGE